MTIDDLRDLLLAAPTAGAADSALATLLGLAGDGHTDAIGGEVFNLDLSRQRAAAVRQALTSRHGVAAARLSTDGQGATRPKAPNNTLEGRALNRRVEIVLATSPAGGR